MSTVNLKLTDKPKAVRFSQNFWDTLEALAKCHNLPVSTFFRLRIETSMLPIFKKELSRKKRKLKSLKHNKEDLDGFELGGHTAKP